jgi:hypothetical protein
MNNDYTGQNGFYCCRFLAERSKILLTNYLKSIDLEPALEYPLHCTVMFSESVPGKLSLDSNPVFVETESFKLLGKSLVVTLKSKILEKHFNKWLSLGCVHSFEDYIPHITVVDNVEDSNLAGKEIEDLLRTSVNLSLFLDKEECFDLQN